MRASSTKRRLDSSCAFILSEEQKVAKLSAPLKLPSEARGVETELEDGVWDGELLGEEAGEEAVKRVYGV